MKLPRNFFSPTWRIKISTWNLRFPTWLFVCWVFRRVKFLEKGDEVWLSLARSVDLEKDGEHEREAPE